MAVKYLDLEGLSQYDSKIKEYIGKTIVSLEDNGSSTAGTWLAKSNQVTSLIDGTLFIYKVVVAGASTTTLKINSLTAKTIYRSGTSKLSTQYSVGTYLMLVYNTTNDCFRVVNDYDSNTTITYGTLAYYLRPEAGETIYRYKFVMFDKDNRLVPLTTTNVSNGTAVTNQTPTSKSFRPDKIYWYDTTTTINEGSAIGGNTLMSVGYNANNSTNGGMAVCNFNSTVEAYRLIYLCGTYDRTTGLFSLRGGGTQGSTTYYTFVPDNTANLNLSSYFTSGYDYILLGGTYSSNTYIHLREDHPMYHFDGTNLVPYDTYNENRIESDIPTKTSQLTNDSGYITSSALSSYVPTSRTINNKALTEDIMLSASDVQALPSTTNYVKSASVSGNTLTLTTTGLPVTYTPTIPPTITINTTNKTISDGTNTLTFGSNAFNSTTIPTSYVSSVNGSTGAITNVAKTNTNNSFPYIQTFTGTIDVSSGTLKVRTINAPTTSGGSSYGAGTDGQVLKTNGSTVYWGNSGSSLTLYKHQITIFTDIYDFDITVVNTISSAMALWEVTNYYSYHLFMMANDWAGAYIYRAGANDYRVNFITLSFDSPSGSPGLVENATASTISDTVTQLS